MLLSVEIKDHCKDICTSKNAAEPETNQVKKIFFFHGSSDLYGLREVHEYGARSLKAHAQLQCLSHPFSLIQWC